MWIKYFPEKTTTEDTITGSVIFDLPVRLRDQQQTATVMLPHRDQLMYHHVIHYPQIESKEKQLISHSP